MSEYTKEQEAVTRERDEARSTLGALRQAVQNALPLDMTGWGTLLESVPKMGMRLAKAEADAARLREALLRASAACGRCGTRFGEAYGCAYCEPVTAALASTPSVEPDYSGLCLAPECGGHCGYVHARGCEAIREYLANQGGNPYRAPTREPTPRDMRVAEAVREACFGIADFGAGGREGVMESLRAIDLAVVVTKAVKP